MINIFASDYLTVTRVLPKSANGLQLLKIMLL